MLSQLNILKKINKIIHYGVSIINYVINFYTMIQPRKLSVIYIYICVCVNDFRIVPTVWYLYAFYLINSVLQIMIKNIMVREIRYTSELLTYVSSCENTNLKKN